MNSKSSEQLLQQLLQGNLARFQDILDWYADDVLRLSYLLLWDEDEARDILQETMLKLVQMLKQGKIKNANGSIKGLLLTIAKNLSINRLKQRSRFTRIDEKQMEPTRLAKIKTPQQEIQSADFSKAFDLALEQLTDIQRAIIVLHDVNSESPKDIAQSLNLTVENVRMHLCRARRKLRQILAPYADEL